MLNLHFSTNQYKNAIHLLGAALALTMFTATAATITFGDLTDPSGLAVNGGVTVTSSGITGIGCANPVLQLAEVCTVTGTLPSSDGVGLTVTNINIYEPNGTDISDTLTISTTPGITLGPISVPAFFTAVFTSDSGLPLTPLIGNLLGGDKLIENGSALNVFTTGGLTFQVASDVDASAVPEPSSMAFLGTGMVGLSLIAAYRRRQAE